MRYLRAIAGAQDAIISAATLVELTMVVEGRGGEAAGREVDAFLSEMDVRIWPVTARHAQAARQAWRRFGKGRHPAALNLGDCFSYALAVSMDDALLYKGHDFSQTDVKAAI